MLYGINYLMRTANVFHQTSADKISGRRTMPDGELKSVYGDFSAVLVLILMKLMRVGPGVAIYDVVKPQ